MSEKAPASKGGLYKRSEKTQRKTQEETQEKNRRARGIALRYKRRTQE